MQPRPYQTRSKRFNEERRSKAGASVREHKGSTGSSDNPLKEPNEGFLLPKVKANEDSKNVPVYFRSMKRMTLASALLGTISILAAFCEGEITQNKANQASWLANTIRSLVILLSFLQIACLIHFYTRLLLTRTARGLLLTGTKVMYEPELRKSLIIEGVLALFVCPPGLYFAFPSQSIEHPSSLLSLGDVLFCLTCIRFYQLFKLAYWRLRQPQDFFIL